MTLGKLIKFSEALVVSSLKWGHELYLTGMLGEMCMENLWEMLNDSLFLSAPSHVCGQWGLVCVSDSSLNVLLVEWAFAQGR